jgi:hypothetical protein
MVTVTFVGVVNGVFIRATFVGIVIGVFIRITFVGAEGGLAGESLKKPEQSLSILSTSESVCAT